MILTQASHAPDIDEPELGGYMLTIDRVINETDDAVSLIFDVADDLAPHFDYQPGQFLTLGVPSDRDGLVARCYSLASTPGVDQQLKVTIKRTAEGYASNWICDNARPGMALRSLPPSGTFLRPAQSGHLLLAAAGSGITPVISILKAALAGAVGQVSLFYANRDRASVIFADELDALQAAHGDRLESTHWIEADSGLPTAAAISEFIQLAGDDENPRQIMVCGPGPFMDVVASGAELAGLDRAGVVREEFRSIHGNPFEVRLVDATAADAATVEVTLDGETSALAWPRESNLVDVMLAAGMEAPYSCREGTCGSCMCTLSEGEVALGETEALDDDDIADGYILACQAKPVSSSLKVEFA